MIIQFNKHFGKAKHKWTDGKTVKYRTIDSDKSVMFQQITHEQVIENLKQDKSLIYEHEVATKNLKGN